MSSWQEALSIVKSLLYIVSLISLWFFQIWVFHVKIWCYCVDLFVVSYIYFQLIDMDE